MLETTLAQLPTGARRDLPRILTAPSNVRADIVRQFHERGKNDMVELLVMLEEEEWKRQAVIEELLALDDGP